MNNVALGFTFLVAGLVLFASALNKTTGAMLSGLIYGEASLKAPGGSSGSTPEKPVAGTSVGDVLTNPPKDYQKAGIVPVSPTGGVPGITVPIIDPKYFG